MVSHRSIALSTIDSPAFLGLPLSTQCLYFHLSLNAADTGKLNNALSICRYLGLDQDNLKILIDNGYIQKIGEGIYKIVHWYENNGVGETAKKRNNYSYRKWRIAILERDSYTCQRCGITSANLNVHHIYPWASDILKRYDISNGITLCAACHKTIHSMKG